MSEFPNLEQLRESVRRMGPSWVDTDFGTEKPTYGNPDTAQIEVEVYEVDGDLEFSVRCMCSACYEIEQVGIKEAMGEVEPGVYYMRSWHTVYPSGPWGPGEYDGGLEIAIAQEKDSDAG